MTLTLELPRDLEHRLTAEASQRGMPVETYALRLLSRPTRRRPAAPPRNGAELVAYWRREGLVGSRTDIADTQEYVRDLRQRAEQRSWS